MVEIDLEVLGLDIDFYKQSKFIKIHLSSKFRRTMGLGKDFDDCRKMS